MAHKHKVSSSSPFWRPAVGCLCALQLLLAVAALAVLASSAGELTFYLRCLAPVALWQCAWSLPLGLLDAQALLARRDVQYQHATRLVTIGDGVTAMLACTSASWLMGIAEAASALEHREGTHQAAFFKAAVGLGFASFTAVAASFFINDAGMT